MPLVVPTVQVASRHFTATGFDGLPYSAINPYSNQAPCTRPALAAAIRVSLRKLRPLTVGLSDWAPVNAVSDPEVKLV